MMVIAAAAKVVVLVLLLAVSIKVFFHYKVSHAIGVRRSGPPSVVIAGLPNAGKTLLFHRLNGQVGNIKTVTSIVPNEKESVANVHGFRLIDCPGHEKLQQFVLGELKRGNPKAVIFVVDAAAGTEYIKRSASLLFSILICAAKDPQVPVLVAVNKCDQFSALSPTKVRSLLESEVSQLRDSKSKGLSSSLDVFGEDDNEEDLGVAGIDFTFSDLEMPVDFLEGSALLNKMSKWEDWLKEEL